MFEGVLRIAMPMLAVCPVCLCEAVGLRHAKVFKAVKIHQDLWCNHPYFGVAKFGSHALQIDARKLET